MVKQNNIIFALGFGCDIATKHLIFLINIDERNKGFTCWRTF